MDDMTMMSVQCNIILNNGYMCGLPPIGRCATCQRAFCASHQAMDTWTRYVDMCAPCLAIKQTIKQAEEYKRQEEAMAPSNYFIKGTARTDLLTAGVPTVKLIVRQQGGVRIKKGIFGQKVWERIEERFTTVDCWLLGVFKWKYTVSSYGDTTFIVDDFLTALIDKDDIYHETHGLFYNGLVRVEPSSKGYEMLSGGSVETWENLREVAQAVKRLAGLSS